MNLSTLEKSASAVKTIPVLQAGQNLSYIPSTPSSLAKEFFTDLATLGLLAVVLCLFSSGMLALGIF